MAYLADALAALIGSMLGVSTVATFAESTAGVAGRRQDGTRVAGGVGMEEWEDGREWEGSRNGGVEIS